MRDDDSIRVGDDLFGVREGSRPDVVMCTVSHATAKMLHVNRCAASGHSERIYRDAIGNGCPPCQYAPPLFRTVREALADFRDRHSATARKHELLADWARAELEQTP